MKVRLNRDKSETNTHSRSIGRSSKADAKFENSVAEISDNRLKSESHQILQYAAIETPSNKHQNPVQRAPDPQKGGEECEWPVIDSKKENYHEIDQRELASRAEKWIYWYWNQKGDGKKIIHVTESMVPTLNERIQELQAFGSKYSKINKNCEDLINIMKHWLATVVPDEVAEEEGDELAELQAVYDAQQAEEEEMKLQAAYDAQQSDEEEAEEAEEQDYAA